MKELKIVQVATSGSNLDENMTYGGIERIVIALKKEYDLLGYCNYILAPAGNNTISDVIPTVSEGYRTSIRRDSKFNSATNLVFNNLAHISRAIEEINYGDYNIVHDHTGKLFPFAKLINKPLLTTLHGPADWFWDKIIYKSLFNGCFFNAVSKFQKKDYDFLNPQYVVYNGLNLRSFPFNQNAQNYLFSLGQITRDKGQHLAIKIAQDLEITLIIGGKISESPTDSEDKVYFETEIRPHLKKGKIEYIGELNDTQKKEYYKNAKAFLMPISCKEAFGLVMIESLACGTPVVALREGAVPEIVQHGINGYITDNMDDFRDYVSKVSCIDRHICRESVINRFDISVAAKNYIKVYEDIIRRSK